MLDDIGHRQKHPFWDGFSRWAQAGSAVYQWLRASGCRSPGARRGSPGLRHGRKWIWTSSIHSVGGPRAGDTGGGSTGSPTCARSLLHADKAILAFVRLRTPGSKRAGSCRRSAELRTRRDKPDVASEGGAHQRQPLGDLREERCQGSFGRCRGNAWFRRPRCRRARWPCRCVGRRSWPSPSSRRCRLPSR